MVYIIYGEDEYLIKKQINHLIKLYKFDINVSKSIYFLEPENLDDIIGDIISINLFAEKKIIIINDDKKNIAKMVLENNFLNCLKNDNPNLLVIIHLLTNELKLQESSYFKVLKVKSYNKTQLLKFINNFTKNNNFIIDEQAQQFLISSLPNEINIYLNELNKLKQLCQPITLNLVKEVVAKYVLNNNGFKIIELLFKKQYALFWEEYFYYNNANYDRINLINILAYQLEILRNIKLLLSQKLSQAEVLQKINISYYQLKTLMVYVNNSVNFNNNLLNLHKLDFLIKKSKFNKNIAIDLFFLNI